MSPKVNWSLPSLMQALHEGVEQDLKAQPRGIGPCVGQRREQRGGLAHAFRKIPAATLCRGESDRRGQQGQVSDQIDIVLFDRQYTPLIFEHHGQIVVPVEAVYALFESKQDIRPRFVRYAQQKVASVRRLHRTSAPVQTIDGQRTATPQPILAGFLAWENKWTTAGIGKYLSPLLAADQEEGRLDFGCIAAYGTFGCQGAKCVTSTPHDKAATCFLLELITRLQRMGTAPAIDMTAYARWLTREN